MKSENYKTANLILYIAEKLQKSTSYGSVILNKALYYIDNLHYLKYGKPVSNFIYVKQDMGPIPKPQLFMSLRQEMIEENWASLIEQDTFGRPQIKLLPKIASDINCFSSEEKETINKICHELKNESATKISEYSHTELGWIFAKQNEEIPFYAFLLTNDTNITEDDYLWAETIASGLKN